MNYQIPKLPFAEDVETKAVLGDVGKKLENLPM
jgi:hypothetical protein